MQETIEKIGYRPCLVWCVAPGFVWYLESDSSSDSEACQGSEEEEGEQVTHPLSPNRSKMFKPAS